ncbi:sugar phosphate isomerase/epimerase family protein [Bailinhaonella thermotolerans]|uniref:Sugar phosphate isomerase/epimerase n=1 Tax=Bailinhaonella thermotolerans TaxID=1070861 RepID=A0A3A4ARL6_9ACTN|nr:sugar phosphate isomerase/epimerase family protein [Bailinhaonella thermotolerans]RJL31771.1 sugar phosphate isomerase/epimerase [Bailinhaonella thermotolerans]
MTRWAFSTLGVPGAPLAETVRLAREHGAAGLELRVHPDEEVRLGLDTGERRRIRALLADAGLEVPCLATYVRICGDAPDREVLEEARAAIALARDLGGAAIRLFPGGVGDGADEDRAVRRLDALAADADAAGVRLLVETHDSHPTGEAVARLLAGTGAAAIWDLLHPWRHGESPGATMAALGDRLAYVQIKDVASPADLTPIPLGSGAVPLEEAGALLRGSGWRGWVSLEWEKAWHPGALPLPEALPGARAWTERHLP